MHLQSGSRDLKEKKKKRKKKTKKRKKKKKKKNPSPLVVVFTTWTTISGLPFGARVCRQADCFQMFPWAFASASGRGTRKT